MVEVLPFPEFCILDPAILHTTRTTGRARFSLYFQERLKHFPALGISNIARESISGVQEDEAQLSIHWLPVMDEIQTKLQRQRANVCDILQIEFVLREKTDSKEPLMGYKVRFAKKGQYEEPWSKLTVGPIPPFARWVVKAPRSAFVVVDMKAMNFFILYGRLPKMLRVPQFECKICYYTSDLRVFGTFQCGHAMCTHCIQKVLETRTECYVCKAKLEGLQTVRLKDGLCPIDGCEHNERCFFFSPCGCAVHHGTKPDWLYMQACPYFDCGKTVEKVLPLYLG